MPKICFVPKRFSAEHREIIDKANAILDEYADQGYTLTLRQLYYQFVSTVPGFPNTVQSYGRLGSIITDARLAGEIDWDAIEDRNRTVSHGAHWGSPSEIIDTAARGFRIDKWKDQPLRVIALVEKDALASVFERTTHAWDMPLLACKGYLSASAVYDLANRVKAWREDGQDVVILHFGDHDPSGIDMTRDIRDRLCLLSECDDYQFESYTTGARGPKAAHDTGALERLALNWEQVQRYRPPPNPAKKTDSRHKGYVRLYGNQSWELDALRPQVLNGILEGRVKQLLDMKKWKAAVARETDMREALQTVSDRWDEVLTYFGLEPEDT